VDHAKFLEAAFARFPALRAAKIDQATKKDLAFDLELAQPEIRNALCCTQIHVLETHHSFVQKEIKPKKKLDFNDLDIIRKVLGPSPCKKSWIRDPKGFVICELGGHRVSLAEYLPQFEAYARHSGEVRIHLGS